MFIPWEKSEGICGMSPFNHIKKRLGLSYEVRFYPKKELKESTDATDEEFEELWNEYKEEGQVKTAFIKRSSDGQLLDVCFEGLFHAEDLQ